MAGHECVFIFAAMPEVCLLAVPEERSPPEWRSVLVIRWRSVLVIRWQLIMRPGIGQTLLPPPPQSEDHRPVLTHSGTYSCLSYIL